MTRLMLVSKNLLFSEGLQSLLSCQARIEIVGQEADATRAIARVKVLLPDVVIVDSEFAGHDRAALSLGILREEKRIKVIELSLSDNAICIYRKEQRLARRLDDLLKAIESEPEASDPARSKE
jgi:DNA-binding NarL/FixJ family response regulator